MEFLETLYRHWHETSDPRTRDWFLVGSSAPILSILAFYLFFVLKWGPQFMEKREPYSLKTFIQLYNIFQIIANAMIVWALLKAGWFSTISFGCEGIDYSWNPEAVYLGKIMWWLYMLKICDLTETGIFTLRKKYRQVSFLHLYHHVSTVLIAWLGVRFIPVHVATFVVLINSAVHIIMYSYYFGSIHNSKVVQAFVSPLKRYITIIQMVQFVILLIHTTQGLDPSCNVPRLTAPLFIINMFINFYLFYDFYKKNYEKKVKKQ